MSNAAQSTWSWNDAPFSTKLDPRRFYAGVSQEESLSRLHFLVENRRRMGIVTGPFGCGKSLLLTVLAEQFRQQNRSVVQLSLLGIDTDEFLWKLAAGLGINPDVDATPRRLWRDIDDHLTANRYQQISTVVMLDDIEEAEAGVLAAVERLLQCDVDDDSQLTVVLACDSEKTHLLGRRLPELCDLLVELEPWDAEEVEAFIHSALAAAACSPDLFKPETIAQLNESTGGIPRQVQQLAQLALVAAAAQDLPAIDEETLDAVQNELSTVAWA